jgi:hypothetical protein
MQKYPCKGEALLLAAGQGLIPRALLVEALLQDGSWNVVLSVQMSRLEIEITTFTGANVFRRPAPRITPARTP